MRDAIALAGLLDNENVKAFLYTIRVGEGTADEDGFRRMFGGELFDSFADHPRRAITKNLGGRPITSTAAGAPQFLSRTWDECAAALGLRDFSPKNQLIAALFLIERRKALEDVIAGRFAEAVHKCNREWASLPGSPYGQPTRTMAQAEETYRMHGGVMRPQEEPAPVETRDIPSEHTTHQAAPTLPETTMPVPALILGLANTLIGVFAPLAREKITKEMARHTDNPEVAERIANSVIESAKTLTGKDDPVEAVVAARAEQQIIDKVQADTLDELERMAPILEKIAEWDKESWAAEESSRDAAAARRRLDEYDMAKPLLFGSMGVVAVLILFVGAVAIAQLVMTGEIKTEIWAAMTGLIGWATAKAGSLYDYRFGTSRSSGAKDVVIGELSKRKPN